MSGTRTVGRTGGCSMFSQDVLPKPIYQLILSEDYNNRIIIYMGRGGRVLQYVFPGPGFAILTAGPGFAK